MITYSYTQIAQYLACPKKYRYRYLDGWQEKDTRAAAIFGRVFEHALGSYFRRLDANAAFFEEWANYRESKLEYAKGESWDLMAHQAVQLLDRFAQENRVAIRQPARNLQVKYLRRLSDRSEYVAYVDAIGEFGGSRSLVEWKTTSARYSDEIDQLYSLDQQLIAYSWISGISDVALVVFVRKRFPEIQYLHTTISDAQREEYGSLVEQTIWQIEAGHFLAHSGVRFPQNGCLSCAFQGLCLNSPALISSQLNRSSAGAQLDWIDELAC
jgi:CRISPR/Cas system-associated exonuclease Cas4 (RecB family)